MNELAARLTVLAVATTMLAGMANCPAWPAPGTGAARLTETSGGFSYLPPPGWRTTAYNGMKYRISYTRSVDGMTPNINVQDEIAPVSMSRYVQVSLVHLRESSPNYQLDNQSEFVTQSGIKGRRLLAHDVRMGHKIRCFTFFFPGRNDRMYIVTALFPASVGTQYDAAVAESMKTFAVTAH